MVSSGFRGFYPRAVWVRGELWSRPNEDSTFCAARTSSQPPDVLWARALQNRQLSLVSDRADIEHPFMGHPHSLEMFLKPSVKLLAEKAEQLQDVLQESNTWLQHMFTYKQIQKPAWRVPYWVLFPVKSLPIHNLWKCFSMCRLKVLAKKVCYFVEFFFFTVFERYLLCSPRLHLFDQTQEKQ